jgi:hypothetical protein
VILFLKLILAPALVVGSSMAGRRWGPPVAGTLVALPIVAGPILLIASLEQGTAFGARAASSSLLGLVSLALFTLVFAWASRYTEWRVALVLAWSICLVIDVGLSQLSVRPAFGFFLVLGSAWAVARLLPRANPESSRESTAITWPWWDLPGRAAATAVLVVAVTTAAGALGPNGTGVLAPFPIATSVIAAFVLAQQGSAATVHFLRGIPQGLLGFAMFCALVAVTIEPFGVGAGFTLAVLGTLITQVTWQRLATWSPSQ